MVVKQNFQLVRAQLHGWRPEKGWYSDFFATIGPVYNLSTDYSKNNKHFRHTQNNTWNLSIIKRYIPILYQEPMR